MNLASAKQQFAADMIALARQLLILAQHLDYLNSAYNVNGFQTGGANVFTDGDFSAVNTHLSATRVADVMFAIGTVDGAITSGIRNSLLEAVPGGQP